MSDFIDNLYDGILKIRNDILGFDSDDISKYNSWEIKLSQELEKELIECIQNSKLYLLNTNKKKFNLIEKIVYELAMFHLYRLNINFDPEHYFIEYWTKLEIVNPNQVIVHEYHVDKDENLLTNEKILKYPLLSTVTYLNDNIYPTIISNIKANGYKTFNKNKLLLSFPKKLKHISFYGNNVHGVQKIFNTKNNNNIIRKTLMFNIWENHVPLKLYQNMSNYMYDKLNIKVLYSKNNSIINLKIFSESEEKIICIDIKTYDLIVSNVFTNKCEENIKVFSQILPIEIIKYSHNIKFVTE
jgi:hypothetical protein